VEVVVALGRRKEATWYVGLVDGRQEGLSRRGAQLQTALESLKPRGREKESFAGARLDPGPGALQAVPADPVLVRPATTPGAGAGVYRDIWMAVE
jgi:hypothetical protein